MKSGTEDLYISGETERVVDNGFRGCCRGFWLGLCLTLGRLMESNVTGFMRDF